MDFSDLLTSTNRRKSLCNTINSNLNQTFDLFFERRHKTQNRLYTEKINFNTCVYRLNIFYCFHIFYCSYLFYHTIEASYRHHMSSICSHRDPRSFFPLTNFTKRYLTSFINQQTLYYNDRHPLAGEKSAVRSPSGKNFENAICIYANTGVGIAN